MKRLLPIANARLSPRAARAVHPFDAFCSIIKHCYGDWRHLAPPQRLDLLVSLRNGEPVKTPFVDRNGIAFIVLTDVARTATTVKLADEQ